MPSDVDQPTVTGTDTAPDRATVNSTGHPSAAAAPATGFTVKLAGSTGTADVMVTYEVSGTADAGADYTAPAGSLTLAAGATEGTINIETVTIPASEIDTDALSSSSSRIVPVADAVPSDTPAGRPESVRVTANVSSPSARASPRVVTERICLAVELAGNVNVPRRRGVVGAGRRRAVRRRPMQRHRARHHPRQHPP